MFTIDLNQNFSETFNDYRDSMRKINDIEKTILKAKGGIHYPGVYSYVVSDTNTPDPNAWNTVWHEHAGFDSPYVTYKAISNYERRRNKKTSDLIHEWKNGTLMRDSETNDWLNSHFILQGYNKR